MNGGSRGAPCRAASSEGDASLLEILHRVVGHLLVLPGPARMAGAAVLVLIGWAVAAYVPGVEAAHLQLLLLAMVLLGALAFGLAAGLVGATLGFGLLLWCAVDTSAPGGWSLGFRAVLDAFLWFALAKLTAALVAVPRRLLARQAEARRAAEAEARQQALLLDEMSHRVMNDLQRLVGLLLSEAAAEPEAAAALRRAAGRVQVLGRVHQKLSHRDDERLVDSAGFVEGLVADLRATLGASRRITLTAQAESHALPLAIASDMGLVVNELVTNALKHAFPGGREGLVRVAFRREDDLFELTVTDNGTGIARRGEPGRTGGLGWRLLRALAAQLGGRVESMGGEVGGTVCRLRFPVPAADARPGEDTLRAVLEEEARAAPIAAAPQEQPRLRSGAEG